MSRGGHECNLTIRFESRQKDSDNMQTSAHLLRHRAEYLHRFDAPRDQRGESAQGRLLGGEPAILGVQISAVDGLAWPPISMFFGDW
jgi:hypothetical protein